MGGSRSLTTVQETFERSVVLSTFSPLNAPNARASCILIDLVRLAFGGNAAGLGKYLCATSCFRFEGFGVPSDCGSSV
jgi:hypothetical protein